MTHNRAMVITRTAVAAVFVWAAWAKLALPPGGPTMYEHWVFLWPLLRYIVPGTEAMLGLWLVIGIWPRTSAIIAILLTSAFTGLLVAEIGKSHPQPCGCMGALAAAYDPQAIRLGLALGLGRNVLIMLGACYLFMTARRRAVRETMPHVTPAQLAPSAP